MAEEQQKKEKRVCPDIWCKSIKWISILGWILLFISMMLFHFGRPHVTTGFEQKVLAQAKEEWNPFYGPLFLSTMFLILYISLTGFLINKKRHKRKEDRYNISLLFLFIFSLMGLSYYFFN